MYELPQPTQLKPLVGASVEAITFTSNTIHLAFSNDVSITIESGYELSNSVENKDIERASVPVPKSGLMVLLNDSIKSIECNNGILALEFVSGRILALDATSLEYESLRIQMGKREIFV